MSFNPKHAAEQLYLRHLNETFSSLLHMLANEETPSDDIAAILQIYADDPKFRELADQAASRMITAQKIDSARSWREAAMKGTQGRAIYRALRQEVMTGLNGYVQHLAMQNAELIRSLPRDLARDVNEMIMKWTMQGLRHEDIAERLKIMVPHDIKTNLELIARTEVSKANSAITEARCQEMDIRWYIWQTAKDGDRVRPSHRLMQGVLVPWSNPPNPEALRGVRAPFGRYHAGGCPNCRCYAEPVIDVSLLPETFRVYTGGGIESMNKAEFQRMIAA